MRRVMCRLAVCLGCAGLGVGLADWMTSGGDAQRSSWIRADAKISRQSMQKPGFEFLWKVKLKDDELTPLVTLDRYIGYRGFRTLGFVRDAADNVFALDTDLGKVEWQSHLASAAPAAAPCAAAPSNLARPTTAAFPGGVAGRGFGGGRSGPARSGVGEPDQGAVTLARPPMQREFRPPPAPPSKKGARASAAPYNPFGRGPSFVHAISRDGMFHAMYVSNGEEPKPPVKFLAPNASAQGLMVVDGVAYAASAQGCGGALSGLSALDLDTHEIGTWKANGGIVGSGPAVGPDGTVYVATTSGEIVALESASLKPKGSYRAGEAFSTAPVIFEHKQKALLAAATKDGRIHLVDSQALGKPLHKSEPSNAAPTTLASWQDFDGTRWLLASTSGAVTAWKVMDQGGVVTLQPGWTSRNMTAPLAPMILNGVVFAVSGGGERGSPAVLYALDGVTGKELWSSGKTITSFVRAGGLSGGGSQVYLGTNDGTMYAFGYAIEH